MVIAGLWAKKLCGMMCTVFHSVDITGQSSIRGMWWKPAENQVTMSVVDQRPVGLHPLGERVGAVALHREGAAGVALAGS